MEHHGDVVPLLRDALDGHDARLRRGRLARRRAAPRALPATARNGARSCTSRSATAGATGTWSIRRSTAARWPHVDRGLVGRAGVRRDPPPGHRLGSRGSARWRPGLVVDFLDVATTRFTPPSRLLLSLESLGMVERGMFSAHRASASCPSVRNERRPDARAPGLHRLRSVDAAAAPAAPAQGLRRPRLGARARTSARTPTSSRGCSGDSPSWPTATARPSRVVGWSLGGIYARELGLERARPRPHGHHDGQSVPLPHRRQGPHVRAVRGGRAAATSRIAGRRFAEEHRPPLDVPATSIYSRTDGIVRWRACIEPVGPRRENVEVIGTHSGLGFNVAAAPRRRRSGQPAAGDVGAVRAAGLPAPVLPASVDGMTGLPV